MWALVGSVVFSPLQGPKIRYRLPHEKGGGKERGGNQPAQQPEVTDNIKVSTFLSSESLSATRSRLTSRHGGLHTLRTGPLGHIIGSWRLRRQGFGRRLWMVWYQLFSPFPLSPSFRTGEGAKGVFRCRLDVHVRNPAVVF
jgi:hypothetical protein